MNNKTETSGFLQVVPPEPPQPVPDPETKAALIALGLKTAEPTKDPIIVQTPDATLRLSEIPEQADSTEDGLVKDDPGVDLDKPQDVVNYYLDVAGIPVNAGSITTLPQVAPPQPVPEEFPLTVDMGKMPWSKVPIREISPLVWFKYEKAEGHNYIVYDLVDGNNRHLATFDEEGIANFFVNAANIYVHASLTTQV